MVETVLSSDKYIDDIQRARALGFHIGVIYIGLASAADSAARVALRRERGGHDVPIDRIMARWERSIAMLGRIAPLADRLYVYDNSAVDGPVLIAHASNGVLELPRPGRIGEIDAILKQSLS